MQATDSPVHTQVPDRIARQIVLPEGHLDEEALYAAYAWLRKNAPLAQVEVEGFDRLWLVSKHADILEIERQPEIFHNGGGSNPGSHNPILNTKAADAWTIAETGSLRSMESLEMMDAPEHTIVRNIAADWFRPAVLKKWEDRIRGLAREAIETRLPAGTTDLDFVEDFAWYYPLHVIMTLFGVPAEDEPLMMKLAHEHFGAHDPDSRREDVNSDSDAAAAEQWKATITDFKTYYEGLVLARRADPREDLASIIANARQADGEYFPMKTCVGYYTTLSGAGHDTTASTLASCIEALAHHPEQLAAVKADPKKIMGLINESLRWATPAKHFVHQAATDYELNGAQIRQGDRLMLLFQSANRDEDVFQAPDEFHFDRKPNSHLAFGSGPHACMGQLLAKQELRIMLEELLPRLESIELAGGRQVVQTNFVGGLKSLPLRLTMGE